MGIFDTASDLFTYYRATLAFRDFIVGATPKDQKILPKWLATGTGISDEETLALMTERTIRELLPDLPTGISRAEVMEIAAERMAMEQHTNGFKRDQDGLYIESRVVKAMLRETVNILYAGEAWGKTRKGPKSFTAERAFINPNRIHLGAYEPSDIMTFIGHPMGPRGVQSNMTNYEVVERPTITFEVMVTRDAIDAKHWPDIWRQAQEIGLGALRSQGHGRFDILEWECIGHRSEYAQSFDQEYARVLAITANGQGGR
jgi:hypothetical protein